MCFPFLSSPNCLHADLASEYLEYCLLTCKDTSFSMAAHRRTIDFFVWSFSLSFSSSAAIVGCDPTNHAPIQWDTWKQRVFLVDLPLPQSPTLGHHLLDQHHLSVDQHHLLVDQRHLLVDQHHLLNRRPLCHCHHLLDQQHHLLGHHHHLLLNHHQWYLLELNYLRLI